jgi:hypothetical protein
LGSPPDSLSCRNAELLGLSIGAGEPNRGEAVTVALALREGRSE